MPQSISIISSRVRLWNLKKLFSREGVSSAENILEGVSSAEEAEGGECYGLCNAERVEGGT